MFQEERATRSTQDRTALRASCVGWEIINWVTHALTCRNKGIRLLYNCHHPRMFFNRRGRTAWEERGIRKNECTSSRGIWTLTGPLMVLVRHLHANWRRVWAILYVHDNEATNLYNGVFSLKQTSAVGGPAPWNVRRCVCSSGEAR